MILMNGISNPMVFGWGLFLYFEFLTVFIEIVVFMILIDFKKLISVTKALLIVSAMNVASALFAIPFWMNVMN